MKILFAGTPEFAVPALAVVASRFPVVGVLTQGDARRGRGRKSSPSPVKAKALELGLPVLEPEKLDGAFRGEVAGLAPDLLVCVAYAKIFGPKFLGLFPEGGINVHPSLLPRFRGPSPIQAAILAGDPETGVTVQRLALKMDTGDILGQEIHPVADTDTAATLSNALAEVGAELSVRVIEEIASGTVRPRPQDESRATYSRLLTKSSGLLDFAASAAELERAVRAFQPWPLAHAFWGEKRVFFLEAGAYPSPVESGLQSAESGPEPASPGRVLGMDKDLGILIHTGDGVLAVRTIQLEYKKALPFREFVNGNREFIGGTLSGADRSGNGGT
ncbi:MAG: methionyl-tRNA formyltransferase [Spirochaetales bacterium]|nr:methionyl-tRNA formyltransferase [Spirochaetales bacterium]